MQIDLKGSPYEGSPAEAFMKSFEEASVKHPLNENARILDNCQVECRPTEGNRGIHLSDIRSFAKGAGTIALRHLCAIADQTGVALSLIAKGYADTPTSVLVRWYVENGFVASGFGSDDDGHRMKRAAKTTLKLGGDNMVIKLRGFKAHDEDDDRDDDLFEAKIMQAGGIKVWKNPSGRELLAIADNLGHDLRGLIDQDDVYVWDAMLGVHADVAATLGLRRPLVFHCLSGQSADAGAFMGMVGRLYVYVDESRMLDFHQSSGFTRMMKVRGFFG